jgi:hypothetical protein
MDGRRRTGNRGRVTGNAWSTGNSTGEEYQRRKERV